MVWFVLKKSKERETKTEKRGLGEEEGKKKRRRQTKKKNKNNKKIECPFIFWWGVDVHRAFLNTPLDVSQKWCLSYPKRVSSSIRFNVRCFFFFFWFFLFNDKSGIPGSPRYVIMIKPRKNKNVSFQFFEILRIVGRHSLLRCRILHRCD